ncbi:ImmA/IrrE family metallo-endopeptidase [Kordiimonas lipolytica]|uniref:ImmA/IrrE family metallo-endopeptidase n=1 Tax=Kordiimonas lipolytica TaxID=1662421 RepID=A0ABV8U870_9PROT|nr:ImmA/IrrE family metallo-endopeptidase [Kordiimonas lipolytica]
MKKRPQRPIDRSLYNEGPELDATALDTPERILSYCRSKGFINGASTDIKAVIESNPFLRLEFDDIGENDAFIEKIDDQMYRIVINARHSRTRQRFSMAHEYIHYQLHRDEIERMPKGERILHRNEERNSIEYQANQLAAEILMPEQTFFQVARASKGSIERIASEFDVSQLAVRYRAKTLGIGGHGL